MRRFTIQDLARPNQQYESRVGDDFQPLVVQAPNLPQIPDFMRLADATSKYLDRKEAHDEQQLLTQAQEHFARNAEGAQAALDRLTAAAEGQDDHEAAWIRETTKMVEEGLLPPQANMAYVRGLGNVEAERIKGNMGRELTALAQDLSQVTDPETGDRLPAQDAQAAFDEVYAKYLDNPLFDQSDTALRIMVRDAETIKQDFTNTVYEQRLLKEQGRADDLHGQAFLSGVVVNGIPIFDGVAQMGSLDLKGEDRLKLIQDARTAIEYVGGEVGVPRAYELFTNAAFSHVRGLISAGEPEEALRVLGALGDIQVSKDLRLEEDVRFAEQFASLFKSANDTAEENSTKLDAKAARYESRAMSIFSGHFNNALVGATTREEAQAAALKDLESDEQYQNLLASSEIEATPEYMLGLFRAQGRALEQADTKFSKNDSKKLLDNYFLQRDAGDITQDELVMQTQMDSRLTAADKRAALEDPNAARMAEWNDHQESSINNSLIRSAADIEGLSAAEEQKLTQAQARLRRLQRSLLTGSDDPIEQVTASSEWQRALGEYQGMTEAAALKVAEAQNAVNDAIDRGAWDEVRQITAEAQRSGALSNAEARSLRATARRAEESQDAWLFQGPSAREGISAVEGIVETMNTLAELGEEDELAKLSTSEVRNRYYEILTDRADELRSMDPDAAYEARKSIHRQAVAQIREEFLPEEKRAIYDAVEDKTFREANVNMRDYTVAESIAKGQPYPESTVLPVEAMTSPASTTPTLEFITKPSTTARRVANEVSATFGRLAFEGDYEVAEKELTAALYTTGAVTPNTAFGPVPAEVRIQGPSKAEIERWEEQGWTHAPGRIVETDTGGTAIEPSTFTKFIESKPSPYTTLFFRGNTKQSGRELLDAWMENTTPESRETFYRRLGRAFTNIEEADEQFRRHQIALLNRLTK